MKWISLVPLFSIILLANCEKEEGFSFGDPQTDLKLDSTYYANSNGLLYVNFFANTNRISLYVYADSDPVPKTEIAKITWHGSITHPIEKNTYWRIKIIYENPDAQVLELDIKWIPIND